MNKDNTPVLFNPASIREMAIAFQKSRVLLTAYELDLFTALDGHLTTTASIAEKLHADEKALDKLLNALVAIGFVYKTHGKYFNTEESSKYLVRGKPEYISGLMHTNHLWNSWSTLTKAVKAGTSVHKREESETDHLDSFIGAMHYRAVPQSKIISMLIDFTGVKKTLDLGGGSGAFSITFIKNNNDVHATILDIPDVVEIAKKYAEKDGVLNKMSFIKGDYLNDDYGKDYDLIFASAIIHINSFEENKNLVQKSYDALNRGGQLVILDHIMNEDRTEPAVGTMFALNMLVNTRAGGTYTESEIRSWMIDAGFKNIERKDTSFGTGLMIGKKL